MKRYIYTLFVGALLSLTSCVQDDIYENIYVNDTYTPSANSGFQFVAAVEDFDKHDVATRADGGVSDAHVSEMTMIIFKGDGKMLPAMDAEQNPLPSNHINIRRSNPTFLIEATRYKGTGIIASMEAGVTAKYYNNQANDLGACRIYIVANAYHLIGERLEAGEIQTEAQLLEALVATDPTLKMPEDSDGNPIGLPMIGTHGDDTFDLSYKTENKNNSVATISMKKLYSKVEFTIQVKSNQVVVGQTPKFTLEDIEIYNIPSQIRMSHVDGDYVDVICKGNLSESNIAEYYLFNSVNGDAKHLALPSKTTAHHDTSVNTDEKIEFVFYMPEHMVTPNTITYPQGMPEDLYQYYKPKGVDAVRNGDATTSNAKIAPFVRLKGSYTDHNAQINKVSYDIYLGQNERDDFEVKRNQRLCNYITITGLTNHKDAYPDVEGNVSIDHRVTMTSKGYNLSMERETILDSHFDVRPLDVELSPGSSMTVVIPAEYKDMIAFESDAAARAPGANTSLYINTTQERKGARKYFTTNLVPELWGTESNDLTLTLTHSGKLDENDNPKTEIHRIWFYIDENPNVYDGEDKGLQAGEDNDHTVNTTLYRNAKVNFFFASDGATPDLSAEPSSTINFQQWNLWRVWSQDGERYYDIEHEEEYLNNYVSDAQYGTTLNGMPWGLDNVQLSKEHNSFYIDEDNEDWNNYVENTSLLKYDFYIGKYDGFVSDGVTVHGYAGQHFTNEIFENSNGAVKSLTLAEQASGAVEYCYNRNKRNADGSIAAVDWYLPSADELEDFIVPAYASFKEFQDNYYWTSQPAYIRNAFYYEYATGGSKGNSVRDAYAFVAYEDNKNYARATKVVAKGNDVFDYALSGLNKTPAETHSMDDNCINRNAQLLDGSYFGVMYAWYRWNSGTTSITFTADEHFNAIKDGNSTGVRYHIHLGHSFDEMYQVDENGEHGYHPRSKSNRVRCVRKDWNPNNNYEAQAVYTVSATPATTLDTSGGTIYVMRNTNYSSTQLTTSGSNLAANNATISKDNFVTIEGNMIKSVAKEQYFNGYDGSVSFNDSATSYDITKSGDAFTISYLYDPWWGSSTTYYLKQTSDTAVSMSSGNNGNNNWYFYEVKKEYKVVE